MPRDARTNIPDPDMLLKFGLAHQAGGLLARPAEYETLSESCMTVRQILQGLQTCGVDRHHGFGDCN